MSPRLLLALASLLLCALLLGAQSVGAEPLPRPQTWVDGELFDGVVTDTAFEPFAGDFDELYMGGIGFRDGVPLISDAGPGDTDYNGGRWHVNVLFSDVDPLKYFEADSVEDLNLADFEPMPTYFECPLLPRRGGR
jgi:hypothetical protein